MDMKGLREEDQRHEQLWLLRQKRTSQVADLPQREPCYARC